MSTTRQTALLRKGNPATAEKQVTLCADSVLRLEVDKRLNNHNTSGPPTLQENLMINYLNLREEQVHLHCLIEPSFENLVQVDPLLVLSQT